MPLETSKSLLSLYICLKNALVGFTLPIKRNSSMTTQCNGVLLCVQSSLRCEAPAGTSRWEFEFLGAVNASCFAPKAQEIMADLPHSTTYLQTCPLLMPRAQSKLKWLMPEDQLNTSKCLSLCLHFYPLLSSLVVCTGMPFC